MKIIRLKNVKGGAGIGRRRPVFDQKDFQKTWIKSKTSILLHKMLELDLVQLHAAPANLNLIYSLVLKSPDKYGSRT
jgi:hypothetical protein